MAHLNQEERARYDVLVATDWIPIEFATHRFVLAAPLLYPGKTQAIRLIGRDLALDNLKGPYKYLARVLTIPFFLQQTGTFWRTYNRRGTSRIERIDQNRVELIVEDYRSLPERFRECMCGWIAGALELAGAKNSIITKSDETPNAWRWTIRWF